MLAKNNRLTESGGALVYIFIGVILFGALAFSFAKGIRTSGTGDIDEKTAKLVATDLIGYANTVASAVSRLQTDGCSETEISFENPYVAGYTNPNAPVDKHCHVFDPAGGNVQHLSIDTDWLDSAYSANTIYGDFYVPVGRVCVQDIGTGTSATGCTDASQNDIIFVIPYLKREICLAVDNLLGITLNAGEPPQDAASSWSAGNTKFTGSFGAPLGIINLPSNTDKPSACFEGTTSPVANSYHFMTVVVTR
jgi:hypothetical protein